MQDSSPRCLVCNKKVKPKKIKQLDGSYKIKYPLTHTRCWGLFLQKQKH